MKRSDYINHGNEGFGVPGDYFSGSAARLRNTVECLDELRELKKLTALKGAMPFTVPAGYFGERMEIDFLVGLPNTAHGFTTPPGFFEAKEEQLLVQTRLAGTGPGNKATGFGIPDGYFDSAAGKISSGTEPQARIIPLRRSQLVSWAMAAMLLVVAGLWIYKSYKIAEEEDCPTIACLEKRDVIGSRMIENLSEDELMLIIDGDELQRELMDGDMSAPERNSDSAGRKDYEI